MNKKFSVSINKKIEKFNKKIKIPGDKSCSIRAILFASQCIGLSRIKNLLGKTANLTFRFITDEDNAPKLEQAENSAQLKGRIIVGVERENWTSYDAAMDSASNVFDTVDTNGTDDALCYFTSGTTDYPKMAIQPHSYGLAHQITGRYWLDLAPHDLHWNISDTGWAKAAWSSFFGPWNCGATLFVHHTNVFSPKKSLDPKSSAHSSAVNTGNRSPTGVRMQAG